MDVLILLWARLVVIYWIIDILFVQKLDIVSTRVERTFLIFTCEDSHVVMATGFTFTRVFCLFFLIFEHFSVWKLFCYDSFLNFMSQVKDTFLRAEFFAVVMRY